MSTHYFNPRSPCGERPMVHDSYGTSLGFQSTLPMRGATALAITYSCAGTDFNPRSPCGERRRTFIEPCMRVLFQSTLPMRGATGRRYEDGYRGTISIHAPHAGSDVFYDMEDADHWKISIHAPHAGSDTSHALGAMRRGISIHAPHAGSDGLD